MVDSRRGRVGTFPRDHDVEKPLGRLPYGVIDANGESRQGRVGEIAIEPRGHVDRYGVPLVVFADVVIRRPSLRVGLDFETDDDVRPDPIGTVIIERRTLRWVRQ